MSNTSLQIWMSNTHHYVPIYFSLYDYRWRHTPDIKIFSFIQHSSLKKPTFFGISLNHENISSNDELFNVVHRWFEEFLVEILHTGGCAFWNFTRNNLMTWKNAESCTNRETRLEKQLRNHKTPDGWVFTYDTMAKLLPLTKFHC